MAEVMRTEYRVDTPGERGIEYFDSEGEAIACAKEHEGATVTCIEEFYPEQTQVWPENER